MIIKVEDNDHYSEILDAYPKCVMFFGSKNCGHCTKMMKFLNEHLAQYDDLVFGYIETTEVPTDNLRGVPLFLLYNKGEIVDYQMGAGDALHQRILHLLDLADDE